MLQTQSSLLFWPWMTLGRRRSSFSSFSFSSFFTSFSSVSATSSSLLGFLIKSLSNLEWRELGEYPCLSISSSALGPTLLAPNSCSRPPPSRLPACSPTSTLGPHPPPSAVSSLLSPPLKVSTFEDESVLRSWVKEKEKLLLGIFPPVSFPASSSSSKSQSLKHLSLSSGSLLNLVSTRFGFLGLANSLPTTWRRIIEPPHLTSWTNLCAGKSEISQFLPLVSCVGRKVCAKVNSHRLVEREGRPPLWCQGGFTPH